MRKIELKKGMLVTYGGEYYRVDVVGFGHVDDCLLIKLETGQAGFIIQKKDVKIVWVQPGMRLLFKYTGSIGVVDGVRLRYLTNLAQFRIVFQDLSESWWDMDELARNAVYAD